MDIFNGFLSVIMHVLIAVFLLIYLPVSWIWRLIIFVFFKPFYKEDVGGKVILITGASSGIGEVSQSRGKGPELAYQYATKGASLVLVARREQALKEVAIAALGKGSPDVLVIKADISIQSECKRVIEEAIAHFTKCADSSKALSRKILEATGAKKFLYPTSIRSSTIKMDSTE
ncbi:11-beta-hydroxysteroid dehydrogenase-like 4B [Dendrobium catenatum]|uniref:11-beta-hydroxysteroid dehydrogenase-like 4B n=1 Tax=Dendrobium catenatum TaxID=906689 RepID=A0A2I0VYX7_9ASPA|nr:11-beta-hydroxysteroid dehydrogenase-like 4B [Dendrobium catenatum]